MSYFVYIQFVHAYFCSRQVRIPGSARKRVCNWRIKISHKRNAFICHVKIYALSAIYANVINLIHASKQCACKQIHRFAAVTRGACCNLKMLSRSYLIYLTKTFASINKIFVRDKKTIQTNEFRWLNKNLVDVTKIFCEINQKPSTKLFW